MSTLEVLLGAILSIIITIVVEVQRKPKIRMCISKPVDSNYVGHPAQHARFLGIIVENRSLSRVFRWLARNAALQSQGLISFFHLDGQPVFSSPMMGRWSGSPEPVPPISIIGDNLTINQITIAYDITSTPHTKMDIHPGRGEKLDIAARFDQDDVCYGWNNEAYFSTPQWRNSKWRLLQGRYLVRVEITSAGEKTTRLFRLCNDVVIDDFRLEPAQKSDYDLFK
ncbi:MAG TPA: hypothetical protein VMT91_11060 [Anaerolineales bacterium]|nr:hypothetical protein [Anaerolineales bacterium]